MSTIILVCHAVITPRMDSQSTKGESPPLPGKVFLIYHTLCLKLTFEDPFLMKTYRKCYLRVPIKPITIN